MYQMDFTESKLIKCYTKNVQFAAFLSAWINGFSAGRSVVVYCELISDIFQMSDENGVMHLLMHP